MFKLVVLSVVLAVAAADPNAVWSTGLATPLAATWGAPWAAGIATPLAAPIATPLAASIGAVAVGGHLIKKRSIVAAPLAAAPLIGAPLAWGRSAGLIASAPVAVAAAPISPWAAGIATPLATPIATPLAASIGAVAIGGPAHLIKKRSIVAAPLAAAPLIGAPLALGRSAGLIASAPVAVAAAPISPWAAGIATPLAAPIATPLAASIGAVAIGGPAHLIKKRSIVAAPLAGAPLVGAPVAWGRSAGLIASAPVAVAAAPIAPLGLGIGARVGLW